MSDESPWGSPPPGNGPHGSPSQPSYQPPSQPPSQPQQPYSQPGTGYGGGPPSYGVPLHQGPQQPRRRTGLVVGIVVAVVLVAAAFAVTLVVAGGDDEPQAGASTEPTSESTSDPTTASRGDIEGDGYTYELPNVGWTDATDEADTLDAPTIDTVIVLGSSIELSQSNIIIEALGDGGADSLEDLEGLWKRNLGGADGATPTDIEDIEIAGERAIGVRIDDRVNANGDPITQIAYLALRNGQQYSIGLSFPSSGDTVSEGDFEKVLDSWAWTS